MEIESVWFFGAGLKVVGFLDWIENFAFGQLIILCIFWMYRTFFLTFFFFSLKRGNLRFLLRVESLVFIYLFLTFTSF